MAATEAIIGYGTTIEVENAAGSGVYVELAEITSLTPPDEQVDEIEATHMKSPGRGKEFIQGLSDFGTMSMDMNYIPGSDTDDFILAWKTAGENRSVKVTWPNGAIDTFPGFVKGYSGTSGVSDKMGITLTLRVAGAPVRS